jgi:hypothetical protein
MNPTSATTWRLNLLLAFTGALGGALMGAALTVIGKLIAGAPPATVANYQRNMLIFGVMGALCAPVVTWSALRRVPLWRTMLEPLLAAVAGAIAGLLLGSPLAFLALPVAGVAVAVWRLNYAYRDKQLHS